MNGREKLSACAMGSIIACYGIYMGLGPGGDGILFGSLMLILGALAGLKMQEMTRNGRSP